MNARRSRIERSGRIRHAINRSSRAVRAPRGREEIVVEVHVHNELPRRDGKAPSAPYVRTYERQSVRFSGSLFSWREHYHPIFEKIVPLVAHKEARTRRWPAWLGRLSVWVAVLAALATVSCYCIQP